MKYANVAIPKKISLRATLKYLGLDLRKVYAFSKFPQFLSDLASWKKSGGTVDQYFMILTDYASQAGAASGHYFHQDLLVAQKVFEHNPIRHVDVGSRIDGFVSHVASFREIEYVDIRELKEIGYENLRTLRADIMNWGEIGKTDSISCLHAMEHFGLGRYGDEISPNGHREGLKNIVESVSAGGRIYISYPIGTHDQVVFNAHRIFHPASILRFSEIRGKANLIQFDFVDDNGDLHRNKNPESLEDTPKFGCGIYTFERIG